MTIIIKGKIVARWLKEMEARSCDIILHSEDSDSGVISLEDYHLDFTAADNIHNEELKNRYQK